MRGFSTFFLLGVLGLGARPGARPQVFGSVKQGALSNTLWLATMTAAGLRYFFSASTTFRAAGLLLIFALAWLQLPGRLADDGRQLPLQSWIDPPGCGCAVGVRLTTRILGF